MVIADFIHNVLSMKSLVAILTLFFIISPVYADSPKIDLDRLDSILAQLEAKNVNLEANFKEFQGIASWYNYDLPDYPAYSQDHDTCASRDYPRGTMLKVEYQGKIVVCRVNDYGPEEWTGRQIDLSSHAFSQLADLKIGLLEVKIYE